ncbi:MULTISPECIES: hypothetical protein [unclassified Chryseobacterium]|uniref:hypothetical protein n=1 Tax=unclassified Chryseobacterium TaxID=2593645 RepID=UPI002269D674|nr:MULTISPECIES: hypothetical protein [unclassified Chryseobacterium]
MEKKVALLMPYHFSLYESIVKNLEANDYIVELLVLSDKKFQYKNFNEKLTNFIQKFFLNNKNFKSQLRINRHSEELVEKLKNIKFDFEYTLVIRPDYFSQESLELLKQKTKVFTAYQWDGFKRYPKILDYIKLFDRFFVFEKEDYDNYQSDYHNLHYTTNFYIDNFENIDEKEREEIFFLGSYLENRIDEIISITSFFEQQNINTNIQIVYKKSNIPEKIKRSKIKVLESSVKYSEMINEIQRSKYLLEFQNTNIHNGLSFRVFESICFKKKLITNNPAIENYDFYHPNNILIWKNQNSEEIHNFLKLEYTDIDPDIYKKYSFSNWINYIFDNKPYIKID